MKQRGKDYEEIKRRIFYFWKFPHYFLNPLTDFWEHVCRIVISLNEVALAFIADIEVGVSILKNEVLHVGPLRHRHIDQAINMPQVHHQSKH